MIKDYKMIATNYYNNGLIYDILAIIPLHRLSLPRGRGKILYLVKTVRIWRGFKLFNIPNIMKAIKGYFEEELQKKILVDKKWAMSKYSESNADLVLFISFALKIFQMILFIGNLSYFVGMMFFLFCQSVNDFSLRFDSN